MVSNMLLDLSVSPPTLSLLSVVPLFDALYSTRPDLATETNPQRYRRGYGSRSLFAMTHI